MVSNEGGEKRSLRVFSEKPEGRFAVKRVRGEIQSKLEDKIEVLPACGDGCYLSYRIVVRFRLAKKHFRRREKIRREIVEVFIPHWIHKRYLREGSIDEGKIFPFKDEQVHDKDGWTITLRWESAGRRSEIVDEIIKEVDFFLRVPEEIHWCEWGEISVYLVPEQKKRKEARSHKNSEDNPVYGF